MNKRINIYGLLLIFFALFCSVLLFFMNDSCDESVEAVIYVNNEVYMNINLSETVNDEFIIKNEYGMNKIIVSDGKICVIESDCPDKICVKTGYTDNRNKPVICMPHRLEIVISYGDYDGTV